MAEITIPVSKDAYTQSYAKGANQGGWGHLSVDADSHPNNRNKGYLEFDISSVPAGSDIASVVLYMYQHDTAYTPGCLYIDRLTSQFVEFGINWNNAPGTDTAHRYTYDMPSQAWAWRSFDITQLYLDARAAGDYLGVQLYGQISGIDGCRGQFGTKEVHTYLGSAHPAYLKIATVDLPPLAFSGVTVSRRYGDKLYLSGKLNNIVASDEICIKYFRPEDWSVHDLPGNGLDYTYLKGTSGTYTFPDDACIPIWDDKFVSGHWEGNTYISAHYEDTGLPGLYYLLVDDVSGNCENPILERCRAAVLVAEPRYQYQVEFSTANLDSPEAVALLKARRREWARVTDKSVEPYGTDCFSVRLKYSRGWESGTARVWICSAYQARTMAKYMPLPPIGNLEFTEYMEYFRAECSCAGYRDSRKYGVPCVHIMAAYYHLNKKPPYCEYLKCP